MIRTAYLRVYEPVSVFSEDEQARWLADPPDADEEQRISNGRWYLTGALPGPEATLGFSEGAFFRRIDDMVYVCPWRTRLRMLAGLLAFRDSVPSEVAEAFVPEAEARRAAQELAALDRDNPDIRSHILQANWHVPLRWFSAFEPTERILTEDRRGLRIRYETRLAEARVRLGNVVSVLEAAWMDDGVIAALHELIEWLELFSADSLLELDYGTVARMFSDDELVEDNCAAVVAACVEALEAGDGTRAGELFSELTDRWAAVRAQEIAN